MCQTRSTISAVRSRTPSAPAARPLLAGLPMADDGIEALVAEHCLEYWMGRFALLHLVALLVALPFASDPRQPSFGKTCSRVLVSDGLCAT